MKFWVNIAKNIIEGESFFQLLSNGKKNSDRNGILFELKTQCELSNNLKKEGSLKENFVSL